MNQSLTWLKNNKTQQLFCMIVKTQMPKTDLMTSKTVPHFAFILCSKMCENKNVSKVNQKWEWEKAWIQLLHCINNDDIICSSQVSWFGMCDVLVSGVNWCFEKSCLVTKSSTYELASFMLIKSVWYSLVCCEQCHRFSRY